MWWWPGCSLWLARLLVELISILVCVFLMGTQLFLLLCWLVLWEKHTDCVGQYGGSTVPGQSLMSWQTVRGNIVLLFFSSAVSSPRFARGLSSGSCSFILAHFVLNLLHEFVRKLVDTLLLQKRYRFRPRAASDFVPRSRLHSCSRFNGVFWTWMNVVEPWGHVDDRWGLNCHLLEMFRLV